MSFQKARARGERHLGAAELDSRGDALSQRSLEIAPGPCRARAPPHGGWGGVNGGTGHLAPPLKRSLPRGCSAGCLIPAWREQAQRCPLGLALLGGWDQASEGPLPCPQAGTPSPPSWGRAGNPHLSRPPEPDAIRVNFTGCKYQGYPRGTGGQQQKPVFFAYVFCGLQDNGPPNVHILASRLRECVASEGKGGFVGGIGLNPRTGGLSWITSVGLMH